MVLLYGIYTVVVHKPLVRSWRSGAAGPKARSRKRAPMLRPPKRAPRNMSNGYAKLAGSFQEPGSAPQGVRSIRPPPWRKPGAKAQVQVIRPRAAIERDKAAARPLWKREVERLAEEIIRRVLRPAERDSEREERVMQGRTTFAVGWRSVSPWWSCFALEQACSSAALRQERRRSDTNNASGSEEPNKAESDSTWRALRRRNQAKRQTKRRSSSSRLRSKWIARLTGLSVDDAYWLCVMLNFAVIAGIDFLVWRKYLAGIVSQPHRLDSESDGRSAKGQRRREPAAGGIESRLSQLDEEIDEMRDAAEKDSGGRGSAHQGGSRRGRAQNRANQPSRKLPPPPKRRGAN